MAIFVWAAVVLARIGAAPGRIVVRFLDMVTIAVPPALPACLTIATVFSIGRLRRRGVYVTGPHTITLAGRLDAVCFDKTGTLTVQGLELQGIVPVANGRFEPPSADMQALPPSVPQLLASCHGLAWLGDLLVGDPLDQKLFAATGWTLVDSHHTHDEAAAQQQQQQQQQQAELAVVHAPGQPQQPLRILRRFEFSSQLMRNLVVVQAGSSSSSGGGAGPPPAAAAAAAAVGDLLNAPEAAAAGGDSGAAAAAAAAHMVYVKGSPEVIRDLVSPGSVPPDFDAVLGEYTREGLRVLALAQGRVLPSMLPESGVLAASQKELEAAVPLELVGLAVLANPLRPDSAGVIRDLQHALVRELCVCVCVCVCVCAVLCVVARRPLATVVPAGRPVVCLACCPDHASLQIRTAMVTGDHVRTAISVAHQCNILPVGRPVLLVDGSSSGSDSSSSSASLSVLYPDGSINKRVSRSTVLAQVRVRVVGWGLSRRCRACAAHAPA
jgi:cation-transporting ATPase 13A3/4/5